ncbi:MAG TPA: hypothetical protein DG753_10245 [Clostridium sp.]|nr:hypothetical protein [Clostridium sp.]
MSKMTIEEFLDVNNKEQYLILIDEMKSKKIDIEIYIMTKVFYYCVLKNKKYSKYIEIRNMFKELDKNTKLNKISEKIKNQKDKKILKSRLVVNDIDFLVNKYNKERDIIKRLNILIFLRAMDVNVERLIDNMKLDNLYDAIVREELEVIVRGEKQKIEARINIDLMSVKEQCEMIKNEANLILYINRPAFIVQVEAVSKRDDLKKYIEDGTFENRLIEEYKRVANIEYTQYIYNERKKERYTNEFRSDDRGYELYDDKIVEIYKYKDIIDQVKSGKQNFKSVIITGNEKLCEYINFLCKYTSANKVDMAMGYVFDSGLTLIEETFNYILRNKGVCNIVAGNLQNYNKSNKKNKINLDITINTVNKLNKLISDGINVRTLNNRFYHGKTILLESENVNIVIVGSSNISASAYLANYEINTLLVFGKSNTEFYQYRKWFDNFWNECEKINFIDKELINFINLNNGNSGQVNDSEMMKIIDNIEDKFIKERFNYWLNKNPYMIHKNLGIKSLENYMAFEYTQYKLIVFDSYYLGNAYYYFYEYNLDELLKLLKNCSKTEIFNLSDMSKRGYHISNNDKLNTIRDDIFKTMN